LSPAGVSDLLVRGPWSHALVSANGARFHVAECGAEGAPMVVFLHGFPEFWWAWRHQLPAVADAGWRAVAMDLRGYGASDKTPRGYDPFTAAADVSGVIRSLGETSAVVVGHGWGGFVAWSTAVLAPRQVRAIAAVAAPHPLALLRPASTRVRSIVRVGLAQLPVLPERRLLARDGAVVDELLRSWSAPGSTFPDAEASRRYRAALQVWPAPHCALEYHRWLVRSRIRSDGRRYSVRMRTPVGVPVLQIDGAQDTATPLGPTPARLLAGPHDQHVLTGAGHFPHEETPGVLTSLLLEWLAKL
jgi:pimeloyl-ACP methyl ester carboxylesterase